MSDDEAFPPAPDVNDLAERRVILLSAAAAAAFMKALDVPAAVNPRLADTLAREQRFRWIEPMS
ncbi:MAG: DUF1778 domain-containing protein [Acidimicrobiia bacterium]|nr:DUF1778 domain-containing protein [Acidimicrobiia bacterium]